MAFNVKHYSPKKGEIYFNFIFYLFTFLLCFDVIFYVFREDFRKMGWMKSVLWFFQIWFLVYSQDLIEKWSWYLLSSPFKKFNVFIPTFALQERRPTPSIYCGFDLFILEFHFHVHCGFCVGVQFESLLWVLHRVFQSEIMVIYVCNFQKLLWIQTFTFWYLFLSQFLWKFVITFWILQI